MTSELFCLLSFNHCSSVDKIFKKQCTKYCLTSSVFYPLYLMSSSLWIFRVVMFLCHMVTHYVTSTRSPAVPRSSLLIQRSPASKNASLQLSRRSTLFLKVLKKQRRRWGMEFFFPTGKKQVWLCPFLSSSTKFFYSYHSFTTIFHGVEMLRLVFACSSMYWVGKIMKFITTIFKQVSSSQKWFLILTA